MNDSRMDDYFDDKGRQRSGVRLHSGGTSWGCVTVNKCPADAAKKWQQIKDLLKKTKTQEINFRMGPHWWNGTGQTTQYGTIAIK